MTALFSATDFFELTFEDDYLIQAMSIIGKYCKAHKLSQLRQFPGWIEQEENARKIRTEINGEVVEIARELTDDDYVYLHQNYTVTDGIFIDENIIFSDVTPEWIEFCRDVLGPAPPTEKT